LCRKIQISKKKRLKTKFVFEEFFFKSWRKTKNIEQKVKKSRKVFKKLKNLKKKINILTRGIRPR